MNYFKFEEFDSPDKPGSGKKMNRGTLEKLDSARGIAAVPFVITSGFRTAKHNASKAVGGKKDSSHLVGYAADIATPDSHGRFKIIAACLKAGFNRIGVGHDFVHVDDDPNKAPDVMWDYYPKK